MQNSFNNISLTSAKRLDNQSYLNDSIQYIEEEDDEEWLSRPEVWMDDVRMNALFAPFRSRDLNPLHFDNKLKFWKDVIFSYCEEKSILQFDQKFLENCFIRKKIKPKCLDLVLNDLLKEKSIVNREEALKPKSSLIQNMFNKLVWTPISWSTSYFFKSTQQNNSTTEYYASSFVSKSPRSNLDSSISQSSPGFVKDDNSQNFKIRVFPNLLEKKANEVLKLLQSKVVYRNVDCVIEYEKIFDLVHNLSLRDKDLELIIKYLETNQKILIIQTDFDKKLVKFSFNSAQSVEQINDLELSFIKLKDSEKKLQIEIEILEEQINKLNNEIKAQLNLSNKNNALKLLKKRKQIEKTLNNKDGILTNIETMIMNIQQADTNQITLDVYSKGLNALKEVNKGLDMDKIDDTLGDIQDIYNQNTEFEEALARSPVANKYLFDEQELNSELNELLTQEASLANNSFDMKELINNLPSIPSDTPKKSSASKPFLSSH